MNDTLRTIKGYVSIAIGLIACPCHLPLTLPILLGLTAGTALGAWLSENTALMFALSTAVFIGGLALGNRWLNEPEKPKRRSPATTEYVLETENLRQPSSCERCEPRVQPVVREPDGSLYEEVQG